MEDQNFKKHSRYVPGYHFLAGLLIVASLILAIMNLVRVAGEPLWIYSGLLPLFIVIILVLFFIYIRQFPIKAQDRAIRAEENFRYFVLTGKRLHQELTMSQVIALRFASDTEFPSLAEKAATENLSAKDIKARISSWRPDNHRA